MREIKFRVRDHGMKNIVAFEWVDETSGEWLYEWDDDYVDDNDEKPEPGSRIGVCPYDYPLIREQYTGLKDKDGVEIYENDIIEWPNDVDGVWSDQAGKTMAVTFPFICGNADLGRVIGSIHDEAKP